MNRVTAILCQIECIGEHLATASGYSLSDIQRFRDAIVEAHERADAAVLKMEQLIAANHRALQKPGGDAA